ncbi:unnamed protein product [Rotaria magnacalcarata]|uniref:Uncharacterized protein n=1 Tax=Rotaria magnacalcarata TaxID=392030 RepID=A0A819YNT4_9BILA|nr:unnamed protein product [Rotaria magnacalcarata]CAF1969408.1 unnamed protein product [Rotaria magnacalcarata]CAF2145275.1 unnamed protein product [Rotaria magnacalcarata]CAF2160458.1 unnamed protein product [Rotaria magnacalcarata]CAF3824805.1 unnamed protein product [Rotaria magnacalcarata]
MYKNAYCYEQRNTTTRAPSPLLELVSNYVQCNLTEAQIKNLLFVNRLTASILTNQLSDLINYARLYQKTLFSYFTDKKIGAHFTFFCAQTIPYPFG